MSAVRKGIELSVGPFTTVIAIDAAESRPTAPATVCLGQPGHDAHDPSPGRKPHTCEICGPIVDYTRTAKALKTGDSWSIVDADDIAEIRDELARPFLNPSFAPSPRTQVDVADGEKFYYLTPTSAGSAYANIRSMVRARPDLAFLGLFTPTTRSQAALFELAVRDDVLVLVERRLRSGLKALPELHVEADKWEDMAIAAVDALTIDFDESTYDLGYATRVAAAFEASGTRVDIAGTTKATPTLVVDDTELGAELKRLVAASKAKPTAKKVAAKKAVAARKAAPKSRAVRKVA